jgi:hypothetical protein
MPNRQILDRGRDAAGADFERFISVPPHGQLRLDGQGVMQGISAQECLTTFNILPGTTAAATADPYFLISGTGTEIVARATKGGINIKSQVTIPADGDNVLLTPAATSLSNYCVLKPASQPRFQTRVMFGTITAMFASIGFDENITDADPSGTAGDGAMFLFAPVGPGTTELTVDTALTLAQHANWICHYKVNGTDTFVATTIPVVADRDYELLITVDKALIARFYIDGVLVATATTALTDGDTVAAKVGLELTGTPGGQKNMDVRYISVARLIG